MPLRRIFAPFRAGSGLPAYLAGAAPWAWTPEADGAGEKLHDVNALPEFYGNNRFDAWTGAVVDQDRTEMLRIANGGHFDGFENSGFGINFSHDAPRHVRLTTPSPTGGVGGVNALRPFPTYPNPDLFADGRVPAMHSGAEVQYQDGRVWWTAQSSTNGEGTAATASEGFNGNWHPPVALSWDRDAVGVGPIAVGDARFPRNYAQSDVWRVHGPTAATFINQPGFGSSAALPSRHRIYGFVGAHNSYRPYAIIDTTRGIDEGSRVTIATANINIWPIWAVGCDDLDIVVTGSAPGDYTPTGTIHVMDPATGIFTIVNAPQNFVWGPMISSPPGAFIAATQPVYLKQGTKAYLLFYSPGQTDQTFIRWLRIPTTTSGAYDPAGAWVWGTQAVTGIDVTPMLEGKPNLSGLFGRFNIIRDLGGEPVLVCFPSELHAVYLCRIGELQP